MWSLLHSGLKVQVDFLHGDWLHFEQTSQQHQVVQPFLTYPQKPLNNTILWVTAVTRSLSLKGREYRLCLLMGEVYKMGGGHILIPLYLTCQYASGGETPVLTQSRKCSAHGKEVYKTLFRLRFDSQPEGLEVVEYQLVLSRINLSSSWQSLDKSIFEK